jgi:glycosyltransferase involved in cell wall biosynthesis
LKVLWFTNTPCNGASYMQGSTIGGGWLEALDVHMQQIVDLHVAFYANWHEESFVHGRTTYHVIPANSIRTSNLKNIFWPHIIDEQDKKAYLDIVDRVQPDLIHIHGTENAFGTILSSVDVPVLTSIQGIIAPYAYIMRQGYEREMRVRVGNHGKSLKERVFAQSPRHMSKLLWKMGERETKYMAKMKSFMGRTDWDRRVCSVMSPGSDYFHGDEILRERFYSLRWKARNERQPFVIHTTSSDSLVKGFTTLVEAARLLRKAGFDFRWQIAGIGEESTVVRVVQKQRDGFAQDNVQLLGRLNADKLVEKMMEADMFLLPSAIENSPNSLCEAMIMGMPCVAANTGGTPSILADGKEGLLIQPGEPWAMAGAIMETSSNYQRALEMADKAREKALFRHDPKRVVEQVLKAYKTLLAL